MNNNVEIIRPFLETIYRYRLEPDQRIKAALNRVPYNEPLRDDTFFVSLYLLNFVAARSSKIDNEIESWGKKSYEAFSPKDWDINEIIPDIFLARVLNRAISFVKDGKTIGVGHLLKSWISYGFEFADEPGRRPYAIDWIVNVFGGSENTPLKEMPQVYAFLEEINKNTILEDDFQYIMAIENDRIVFRGVSVLNDYIQSENGILTPRRALLTHFKEQFAVFTVDEILELEELINSKTSENDFQKFFEKYPHFFRKWDYREVYPHVYLKHKDMTLIPDFILTDRDAQKAAIIELKLPTPKLIRRQSNRDRFAATVMEARSQLLRYRDWFRDEQNRKKLVPHIGMEIYEPNLSVIIGRSSDFVDEFDRQRLKADNPDIEIVTYDDIIRYSKRRRVNLGLL